MQFIVSKLKTLNTGIKGSEFLNFETPTDISRIYKSIYLFQLHLNDIFI